MPKAFVMYRLKPGATIEQYREFSKKLDQQVTPNQPHVQRFEVFEIKGAEKGEAPYQIMEVVEVDSFDGWLQTVAGEGMKKVLEGWNEVGDAASIVHIWGERIEPG